MSEINVKDRTEVRAQIKFSQDFVLLNRKKLSDEELVKAFLRDRDEEAFGEIVNRYGDKIYGLALRITRNPSDAEEILQEVLIALIKVLDRFRRESKFSTWLYRIAVNISYKHIRTEKKKYEKESSFEDYVSYDRDGAINGVQIKDWSDRPDEELQRRKGIEAVENAVSELPELYKIVFHLRDVEELTNTEVAKSLGLSVTAVKSRILRARLFLRDRL